MFVIVAYDICTDTKAGCKRLRKIAKICQGMGQRVQNSVFECEIDEVRYVELLHRLRLAMHHGEGNIRIYRLPSIRADMILQLGRGRAVDFSEPLIL